ncbi:MAG TPA: DUF5777 family beta-barrel protein [Longimicrobiales bacterium]|nr:DUF5777 family beta-barrel protein [Longimicrobiales bacterium]
MKKTLLVAGVALLALPATGSAQDRPAGWQRQEPSLPPISVFHSTQSANLPTAETLGRGEWLFEISHRFQPAVSAGAAALWGLDGPVVNRLALAYGASDRAMVGVVRSNLSDNVELGAKLRFAEGGRQAVPFTVAAAAGVAWNTELPDVDGFRDNESQAYAQLIVNALPGDRLAVGIVPTFVRNPRVGDDGAASAFVLGLNGQLYVSDQMSFFAEWAIAEEREGLEHDAGSFGIELETGGHFFKLLLGNSTRMNPAQFLGGTPHAFDPDGWRLGFNVTRLLVL